MSSLYLFQDFTDIAFHALECPASGE